METNLSYEAAYRELAQIAKAIETDAITIDVLADKIKRASELITYCQAKLQSTETEVNNIISKMDTQV